MVNGGKCNYYYERKTCSRICHFPKLTNKGFGYMVKPHWRVETMPRKRIWSNSISCNYLKKFTKPRSRSYYHRWTTRANSKRWVTWHRTCRTPNANLLAWGYSQNHKVIHNALTKWLSYTILLTWTTTYATTSPPSTPRPVSGLMQERAAGLPP